jgi:hypothetical protein
MFHERIKKMNKENRQTLLVATERLTRITGAEIETVTKDSSSNLHPNDFLEIKLNQHKEIFNIELRQELRSFSFSNSLINKDKNGKPFLLISQYIPKTLREELKERNINYLEVSGNCFIKTSKIFIYINDQKVSKTRIPQEGKLWKAAGLKFLFAILRFPELLNKPYRIIAEQSEIALGNIGGLLEELSKEGFLKKGIHEQYFIENQNRLIERWAEAYKTTLRPKLMLGNFKFLNKEMNKSWKTLKGDSFKWGGENAGALLTKFLQPEKFIIYTEDKNKLMKSLKLVPDPQGEIEVLDQFWSDKENKESIVPSLLAYADLITSFDSRNIETANRIKTLYLD